MDWTQSHIISNIPEGERAQCVTFFSPFIRRSHGMAGDVLHFSGDIPEDLVIVEDGVLQSVQYTNAGEEFSPFYYMDGACVFHIAMLTRKPVMSCCIAVSPVDYIKISRDVFIEALERFPEFQKSVLLYICRTSEELINHFFIAQMKKPRHKICKYLIEISARDGMVYTLPFSTEKLAVYLNLARPTLSKELHLMEDDGLIKLYRGKIQIVDIKKIYEELNGNGWMGN